MQFLQPVFLWAAAAAAAPILIHLLVRQRRRRFAFSTLRFLQAAELEAHGRRRLREWLVLLLRTLTLLLLALALAHPIVLAKLPFGTSPPVIALVVDNSYSMTFEDASTGSPGQTRFQHAQRAAKALLQRFPNAPTALFAASQPDKPLVPFTTAHDKIIRALQALQVSYAPVDLSAAVRRAQQLLQTTSALDKRLYLFTDLQHTTLSSLLTQTPKHPNTQTPIHLVLVDVRQTERFANVALIDVRLTLRREPSLPRQVQVQAHNFSSRPLRGRLECFVGGKPVSFLAAFELPPRSSASAHLSLPPFPRGFHQGQVQFTGDALTLDNVRYFAFEELYPLKVLCVEGQPQRGGVLFVRAALEAVKDSNGQPLVHMRLAPLSALNRALLQRHDAVVLVNLPRLTASAADALQEAVRQGLGVVMFASNASSLITHHSSPRLEQAKGKRFRIGWLNAQHPALHGLSESDFSGASFVSRVACRPPKEQILLGFEDGKPLLFEQQLGRGAVLTFTTPLNLEASDLPLLPAFVPLLYRLVAHAALSSKEVPQLAPLTSIAHSPTRPLAHSDVLGVFRRGGQPVIINLDCFDSDLKPLARAELVRLQQQGWEHRRAQEIERGEEDSKVVQSDLRFPMLWAAVLMLLLESLLCAPPQRKKASTG